jgi:hypothetical protein
LFIFQSKKITKKGTVMLVEIFCEIDDFCKLFTEDKAKKLLEISGNGAGRKPGLTPSDIMTIAIYYHVCRFTSFKDYYNVMIKGIERGAFSKVPSYNRFIELRQQMMIPLLLFTQTRGLGKCDGISIIDSTTLEVCDIRRSSSHKMFKGIAQKGKTSTGWFYGFKLHCVINSTGEVVSFFITPGNVADNNPSLLDKITKNIFGKMAGDRGYIGAFKQMHDKGIELIHGIRKNMKNKLMDMFNKMLLKKRGIIESVFGILKEWMHLESSKNRSQIAYFTQIFASIAAYYFKPQKPHVFPDKLEKLCAN